MLQAVVMSKFLSIIDGALRGLSSATFDVFLFTNNPGLNVNTTYGSLTQPVTAGLGPQAAVLSALEIDADGNYIDDITGVTFQPTAVPTSPETVLGIGLSVTISATTYLLAAELLDTPKVFAAETDAIDVIWQNIFLNASNYGGIAFAG